MPSRGSDLYRGERGPVIFLRVKEVTVTEAWWLGRRVGRVRSGRAVKLREKFRWTTGKHHRALSKGGRI